MEYKNKASLEKNKKRNAIIVMVFLGCVGCASLFLAVYNIINHKFIFALAYIVACILSVLYTVMRVNTVIPVFLADDYENIYMRVWENGFFPFNTQKGFIGEFIPEKTKNIKIDISEIKSIYIGSGNFISRNIPESRFSLELKEYKKKYYSVLKGMEFIHITLKNEKEKYMPVTDFDVDSLAAIIKDVQKENKNLKFTTGNRHIRRKIPSTGLRLD